MAAITIRDLGDDIKERLRVQAAENGRSMEAEARAIIDEGTARPKRPRNLGMAFVEMGARLGGVELDVPDRNAETERQRDPFESLETT
jgi:plasmid stability protein